MGHEREREVGDGRREIRRGGEMGKVLNSLDGMSQNLAWLPMNGNYDNVHMYHSNRYNLPPE